MTIQQTTKIECTKNITKKKLDKTFFIDREKKTVNIHSASALKVIDNFNLTKKNILGTGSFNTVKEFPLSDKCEEKDRTKEVAVRIRTLTLGSDIFKQTNTQKGGIETIAGEVSVIKSEYILDPIIMDSIHNLIDFSKNDLHPKVYEIKVIEHNGQFVLVIVMEKYKSDLRTFIEKYQNTFRKDIHHQLKVKDGDVWPTSDTNNDILIQLLQKTVQLVENVSKKGYFCYDIKAGNIVVNYDMQKQTIDLRMIDVDADFCIKNILVQSDENVNDKKTFTKLHLTRQEIYKNAMLALLAQHLYIFDDFNYLSNYFFGWNQITRTIDKYLSASEKIKGVLNTIDEAADHKQVEKFNNYDRYYLGDLTKMIRHYFFSTINDHFSQNLFCFNREFKKKGRMGFGLKYLLISIKKLYNTVNFSYKLPEILRKQKQIEAIEVEPDNFQKVDIQPTDNVPPPEPKDTPIKKHKKQREYKEHKEEHKTPVHEILPAQESADSKGGKKTQRRTVRNKRHTRKTRRN